MRKKRQREFLIEAINAATFRSNKLRPPEYFTNEMKFTASFAWQLAAELQREGKAKLSVEHLKGGETITFHKLLRRVSLVRNPK